MSDSNDSVNMAATESASAENKGGSGAKSHYNTLGITSTATPEQIEEAYNALVIQYSPKVSEGDAAAADAFEKINVAYQVVSDPTKRAEHDTQLAAAAAAAAAAADESSGRKSLFGKAFDVFLSRLPAVAPAPVPAGQLFPPAVLETASEIITSGGFEGGGPPMDARVADMIWGAMTESRVERGAATFFRLTVDVQRAENGFVVLCRSAAKGRFKLAMFSGSGSEVLYQEDSARVRNRSYTQAALYFTSFDTYQFAPVAPSPAAATAAEGAASGEAAEKSQLLPPFFTKLDNFTSCKKNIAPGQYLVCVYGDNFIGRTAFSIVAVPAKNDAPAVTEIEETDEALVECKGTLQTMKTEYAQAKAAYEALVKKVKAEEEKMENLLVAREKSYQSFLDASTETYLPADAAPAAAAAPSAAAAAPAAADGSKEGAGEAAAAGGGEANAGGLGVYGASLASTGYSVASSAATVGSTAATAAAKRASEGAGWLVGRVSTFLKRDSKLEGEPAEGDASGAGAAQEPSVDAPTTDAQPAADAHAAGSGGSAAAAPAAAAASAEPAAKAPTDEQPAAAAAAVTEPAPTAPETEELTAGGTETDA